MKFIQVDEIKNLKLQHIVDDTSSEDLEVLSELELMAIAEVSAYIGNLYDVDFIFSRVGDDRHNLIRRITTDYIIYYLFQRVSGDNIPVYVLEKLEQNIAFLTKVAKGTINIKDLPKLDITLEGRLTFKANSETRFVDDNSN